MTDATAMRSRMMAGIRSRNTKPERVVRCGLHRRGLRFRLHARDLPGSPDLVLPRWQTVIFVHGCFWHGHDCRYFHWPKTRAEFWRDKINGNRERDSRIKVQLHTAGWRVVVIWECAFRGKPMTEQEAILDRIFFWITNEQSLLTGEFHGLG